MLVISRHYHDLNSIILIDDFYENLLQVTFIINAMIPFFFHAAEYTL